LYEELQEIVLNYNVHTTYNNLKNPSTEISLRRLKPKRLRHPGYIRSLIRRQEDFKVWQRKMVSIRSENQNQRRARKTGLRTDCAKKNPIDENTTLRKGVHAEASRAHPEFTLIRNMRISARNVVFTLSSPLGY
jgi:hypothetical protein